MRIVLVGPPGVDKVAAAAKEIRCKGLPLLTMGPLVRAATKSGTELGAEAAELVAEGQLLPDHIVTGLVIERISEPDCREGFVLDGYPRSHLQARLFDQALGSIGSGLDLAIVVEASDKLLVERITGESLDSEAGKACAAKLEKYYADIEPMLTFYRANKLLRRVDV